MLGIEGFDIPTIQPLKAWGLKHSFFAINYHTVINTWIVLLVLLCILLVLHYLFKKSTIAHYIISSYICYFMDLTTKTIGKFIYPHFAFFTAIFTYILLSNWISIIPWVKEPTTDLNTTLALGITTFFYKETQAIKIKGFSNYIKEFLQPFFLMAPLNIVGHFSKVISMSFRLFGNIFGSSIITSIYAGFLSTGFIWQLLGIISGLNIIIFLFFVLFEGLIQAFVFAMLTISYLSIEIQIGAEA